MTDDIDRLLANFAKELDYFVFTRHHLQPLMARLVRAVERSPPMPRTRSPSEKPAT